MESVPWPSRLGSQGYYVTVEAARPSKISAHAKVNTKSQFKKMVRTGTICVSDMTTPKGWHRTAENGESLSIPYNCL